MNAIRICTLALLLLTQQIFAADPVTVSGVVPDEATRSAIITKLKQLYSGEREVIDQLTVGMVVTPPEWSKQVQRMLTPDLKTVTQGQLSVNGNAVTLKGNVSSDATRQVLQANLSTGLNPAYSFKNELKAVQSEQSLLDQTLANRIVEFESGSSRLTVTGLNLLNEMAAAISKLGQQKILVIGHTDSQGNRESNIELSKARAAEVKAFLTKKGIPDHLIAVNGMGPDQPVAPNNTDEGRRRNRRIEFKMAE